MRTRAILVAGLAANLVAMTAATSEAATQDILAIGTPTLSLSTTSIGFSSPVGSGAFDVGSTSTGAFSTLGGSNGTFATITAGGGAISNFLSISALPTAQFTLTNLGPGNPVLCGAAPTLNQTCSASAGSPIVWMNTSTGAVASFSASGTVKNTSTGATNPFVATFSTEFTGQTYQTLLPRFAAGDVLRAPYSASFSIASGDFAGTLDIGQPSLSVATTAIGFSPAALTIGPASTGDFASLSGSAATLHNILAGSGSVPNFLSLASLPGVNFTLTNLGAASVLAVCSGAVLYQPCTDFVGSPFIWMNTPGGLAMFFSGGGTATDAATLQQTPFEATFATEYPGQSFQTLFASLAAGGLPSSFSVEFAAGPFGRLTIPEPGTLALIGLGLMGLAALRRRQN